MAVYKLSNSSIINGRTEYSNFSAGNILSPANITGLYLWLDASDANTFSYSSGTSISQWNDKSGNGYHATQSTTSKQPTRQSSGYTGVKFDGSDDVLSTTASFNGATFTTFMVIRDQNSGTTMIGAGSGGTNIYWVYRAGNDAYYQFDANWGLVTNTWPSSAYYSVEVRYNGGAATNADKLKGRFNGSEQTLSYTGTIPSTLSRSGQTTAIGAYSFTPALPTSGVLSELISYNKVLDNSELTQIRNYLSSKWGITA